MEPTHTVASPSQHPWLFVVLEHLARQRCGPKWANDVENLPRAVERMHQYQ